MSSKDRYALRGVSAQKEEVHAAVKDLYQGLFPKAFCKIYPDYLAGDPDFCSIMHADGAGTKSSLAYMYWKETGDISVWKGIAIDAIVMNLDDMLCAGATGPFTFSSTIGRNKLKIPGEVIAEVIQGTQSYFDLLKNYGLDIHFLGGETADVGDLVRTIIVDGTMTCRLQKSQVIDPARIQAGDVVVSLASYGQASYENQYNSGMGSNGLTSARHELLHKSYAQKYPESIDPDLPNEVVYNGEFRLTDPTSTGLNIGQMLLSPTRTYVPIILPLLKKHSEKIHALIHCSGGAQTKIMHYMPEQLRVVKNNLLPIPPLFELIQKSAGTDWREMYQVFNMGQRMEVYTDKTTAEEIIDLAKTFQIEAQISGFVEDAGQKSVLIQSEKGEFLYA